MPDYGIDELLKVMCRLRAKDGCPWDQRQDHRSLRPFVLEEAYEVIEAINKKNMPALCEELGDLLLQVVFHCQLAAEAGYFTFYEVVKGLTAKLIRRHPHVFGNLEVHNIEEVKLKWETVKRLEKDCAGCKNDLDHNSEYLLPALIRATKVQQRVSNLGFDWTSIEGAVEKLREELSEFEDVYKKGDPDRIEEELGDFLFSTVNVSRFLGIDPELSLMGAVNKFLRRFTYVEKKVREKGGDFSDFEMAELDKWWNEAKNIGY